MERRSLLKGAAGSALAASAAGLSGMAMGQQGRKILVIASNQDIPNFDPHVATGYSASMLLRNTYDSLVRVEGSPVKVVPHLAASWMASPNGLEYNFKLDPAARFNDGSPVTADDFVYSWRRLVDPATAAEYAYMLAPVVNAEDITAGKKKPDELGVKEVDAGISAHAQGLADGLAGPLRAHRHDGDLSSVRFT